MKHLPKSFFLKNHNLFPPCKAAICGKAVRKGLVYSIALIAG